MVTWSSTSQQIQLVMETVRLPVQALVLCSQFLFHRQKCNRSCTHHGHEPCIKVTTKKNICSAVVCIIISNSLCLRVRLPAGHHEGFFISPVQSFIWQVGLKLILYKSGFFVWSRTVAKAIKNDDVYLLHFKTRAVFRAFLGHGLATAF